MIFSSKVTCLSSINIYDCWCSFCYLQKTLKNKHTESMEIMHLFRPVRILRLITLLTPLTFTYLTDYNVQTPFLVFTAAYRILSQKSRKELSIYLGGARLALKTAWDLQGKNDFLSLWQKSQLTALFTLQKIMTADSLKDHPVGYLHLKHLKSTLFR